MFEELSGVYMIKCISTDKYIIGETGNVKKRLAYHIQNLKGNRHENLYLQNAWNKYGEDKFSYHVLEYCDFSECKIREDYYCKLYDSHNHDKGFNLRPTGIDLKSKFPQETKDKIKKSLQTSEKFKNRDSGKGMRGKKHSEKTKLQMSTSAKGRVVSKETKEKLSKSLKGKKRTQESLIQQINTRKNNSDVWHSLETLEKMKKPKKSRKSSKYDYSCKIVKKNKDGSKIHVYDNIDLVPKEFNKYKILEVCNKERKTQNGYLWEYLK
jgi:group I intron endonuclease